MAESDSLIRARELGNAVATAMAQAGLNVREVAEALGWSHATLVRVLAGRAEVDQLDLIPLLAMCLVTGPEREQLLALNRTEPRPGWARNDLHRRTLIDHEVRAGNGTHFAPNLMPDLLQTRDYALALFNDGADYLPDASRRFEVLMRRQNVLSYADRPRRFTFFLHERVTRIGVGSVRIQSDQLCHLMRMSTRPDISVRIVPAGHGDIGKGPCVLLEFADGDPVVYLERLVNSAFRTDPVDVDAYRDMFAVLASASLGEGQSRELIANRVVELYEDRE
ncbi:MAG TPA: helix-turn-helix transcriptional regulator [Pseudonocardiaceae bacterium]|nr:helix-turn-helix transcriptional regulator [Pseudonocardiaceae bacterium]